MSDTRRVFVQLVTMKWELSFVLVCAANARFTEHQMFEIMAAGKPSVQGKPMQVVNQSDGVIRVRMLAEDRDLASNLARLRALPNVSNIQQVR